MAPKIFADKACDAEFNFESSLENASPENNRGNVKIIGSKKLKVSLPKISNPNFENK